MTDYDWIWDKLSIQPTYDQVYFFSERVGIILDSYPASTDFALEDAREQALKELKAHDF